MREVAQDLDGALTDAGHSLDVAAESSLFSGVDGVSAIATTTVAVQVTTEVTVTANLAV